LELFKQLFYGACKYIINLTFKKLHNLLHLEQVTLLPTSFVPQTVQKLKTPESHKPLELLEQNSNTSELMIFCLLILRKNIRSLMQTQRYNNA
jgi:spore coat polysaccharide biosynthesis predicted glycosyltransferase SpsG